MKIEKHNVVLYYPSKVIGGAQLLFVRMANKLGLDARINVFVIDYQDGFLRRQLSADVVCLTLDELNSNVSLKKFTVICPLSMILSIKRFVQLKTDVNYIFWCIHPENTIDILRGGYRLKKIFKKPDLFIKAVNCFTYPKIRKAIAEGLKESTIFFMDEPNKTRTLAFYGIESEYEGYLPVPIELSEQNETLIRGEPTNMVWIGRLSHDKIYSLLFVMRQLNMMGLDGIVLHVVGDGEGMKKIIETDYPNITIFLHGVVPNAQLDSFLSDKKIGLALGMGTSILETSIRRVPTLLIDPSYRAISSDYSPRWVFEIQNFNLGSFQHRIGAKDFSEYISEGLSDNTIGDKCYRYVKDNHSLEVVAKCLFTRVQKF